MPTYIANIETFDAAFKKSIDDDIELEFDDELEAYDSHLFSMVAAEMIENSKSKIPDPVFTFFATIYWDWMGDDGVTINESALDPEESMLNSAIPAPKVLEIYENIKSTDVSEISELVFQPADTDIFEDSSALKDYLAIWWSVFEKASASQKGVLVQAD